MTGEQTIVEVDAVDCLYEPKPWRFASEQAAEIDLHWQRAVATKPSLFNGRVLLLHRGAVERSAGGERLFRGAYLETEFKAFLAWCQFGFPDAGVRNGFGMAALSGADGGFVLGEMGPHTANAGRIYFASGTPDPSDIADGRVDLGASVRRELLEETGLAPADVTFDSGFTLVMDRSRVGFMKRVRSAQTAERLKARIEAFLASEAEPELARMHLIRRRQDIGPAVQSSCATFLRAALPA